jgi:hypothetical protein
LGGDRYHHNSGCDPVPGLRPGKKGFNFTSGIHLSIGQETVTVGTMAALRPDDYSGIDPAL